ncbi:MAG: hypothetical protein CMK32_09830 [Porticoccaceae bacterium]|nr:hypothetical protein [Porticoccaceae bacterium]
MFSAKVLADSFYEDSRLTTLELTYPRFVHSEVLTHRMLSRNAASSRAIPVSRMLQDVRDNPVIPIHWGKNQKGMQAWQEVDPDGAAMSEALWLAARDEAVSVVEQMQKIGVHKQIANRLLEPWMWITVIASATNWSNFFALRCHPDAEPHIRKIANLAKVAIIKSSPQILEAGQWHLPLIGFDGDEKLTTIERVPVSTGRCARVSYLTHDGKRDVRADIDLHDRLVQAGHWSPFEHQAMAAPTRSSAGGNFGSRWIQYRKTFEGECR